MYTRGKAFAFIIAWFACLICFSVGLVTGLASDETKIITKTVTIQASTTTTEPWFGIQCMVNGYVIKTDLAHAEEAGCE